MPRYIKKYQTVRSSGLCRKPRLSLFKILPLLVIVGGTLLLPKAVEYRQVYRYNKIRKNVEKVFAAEQDYFAEHGHFTADLNKIDLPLPPEDVSKREYERAHYEYDERHGYFYVPESLIYYTQSGDHYYITVSEEQSNEEGSHPINMFDVIGFGKNLFAAYRKAYGYGTEYKRQFNRIKDEEIFDICYSVGDVSKAAEGLRTCKNAGFTPSVIRYL